MKGEISQQEQEVIDLHTVDWQQSKFCTSDFTLHSFCSSHVKSLRCPSALVLYKREKERERGSDREKEESGESAKTAPFP